MPPCDSSLITIGPLGPLGQVVCVVGIVCQHSGLFIWMTEELEERTACSSANDWFIFRPERRWGYNSIWNYTKHSLQSKAMIKVTASVLENKACWECSCFLLPNGLHKPLPLKYQAGRQHSVLHCVHVYTCNVEASESLTSYYLYRFSHGVDTGKGRKVHYVWSLYMYIFVLQFCTLKCNSLSHVLKSHAIILSTVLCSCLWSNTTE